MRRLMIVADQAGWCFARRAQAIQRYAPDNWDVTIEFSARQSLSELPYESADLVFFMLPHKAQEVCQIFQLAGIDVPLVIAHNSGIDRKGYGLEKVLLAADYVIINSYATWQHHKFGVKNYRACNISNGVDTKVFQNRIPWQERSPKALWIGSDSKAEDKDDVKGWERTLRPLSMILENNKDYGLDPDFRIVQPERSLSESEMVDYYNSGQVLLCASKSEGTPNIALEAAACGTTVVTTRVGNMPELIRHRRNGFLVTARAGIHAGLLEFLEEIEESKPLWKVAAENMAPIIAQWDWSFRVPYYFALFNAILEKGAAAVKPFSYLSTAPEAVGR